MSTYYKVGKHALEVLAAILVIVALFTDSDTWILASIAAMLVMLVSWIYEWYMEGEL